MSSTKNTVAPTTKTILTTSANWEDWNDRFINQAIMHDLLDHVQGTETLLRKPLKPVMADFAQKARSTTETPGQGPSEGQTMSPELEPREVTFSDLTSDGQKSFNMAWNFYQDDTKTYDKQKELIRKFKEWIAANVSSHYQKTCCKPKESLTIWYENLKKAAGINKRSEDANAREKYREALKTPKEKDLVTWADCWEQAMTVAKHKKLTATNDASEWFEDFLVAIRGILPNWAEAYGINKDTQVDDNSLDYRTVANDLRRVAGRYAKNSRNKFAKGSFGPTFADDDDFEGHQHAGSKKVPSRPRNEAAPSKIKRASLSRKVTSERNSEAYRANKGRKRKVAYDRASVACRACERSHDTERCFYLFPKRAPEGWTPRSHIEKLVKQNLKDDSTLEEEVKQWTKIGKKEGDADD
jgi:hypothetical protein